MHISLVIPLVLATLLSGDQVPTQHEALKNYDAIWNACNNLGSRASLCHSELGKIAAAYHKTAVAAREMRECGSEGFNIALAEYRGWKDNFARDFEDIWRSFPQ